MKLPSSMKPLFPYRSIHERSLWPFQQNKMPSQPCLNSNVKKKKKKDAVTVILTMAVVLLSSRVPFLVSSMVKCLIAIS